MEVKGVPLETMKEYIKTRFGEDGLQKVIDSLKEEDREIFREHILLNNWFDLDILVRFANAMVKELNNGNESVLEVYGEWAIKNQIKGVYKFLVAIISPESFIKKASYMMKVYYRGGECSSRLLSPGNAVAVFKGYQEHQWCMELIMKGWIKGAFEIVGAKNCITTVSTSLKEKKGYFEISGNWEK
jgi:hypothetical protein